MANALNRGSTRSCIACLTGLLLFGPFPEIVLAAPNIQFWVSPNDQALSYPNSMSIIPDEHTTFIPVRGPRDSSAAQPRLDYLVFVAANNVRFSGTFVLETKDLVHFNLAPGYGNPWVHGSAVMWPPNAFTSCQYTGPTVFDQNYAAPGSVLQDPTRAPGNYVMIYEAERHCPGGNYQFKYWASVGLARSADSGKTWPQPGQYGTDRYLVLSIPGAEPPEPHPAWGDALPSAFIDDVRRNCDDGRRDGCAPRNYYLYAVYHFNGTPTQNSDGYVRIARAKLSGGEPLKFKKWYVDPITKIGGWTEDGNGGLDSGVMSMKGCAATPSYQVNGQISYVDALRVYLLTFVCVNMQKQSDGSYASVQAGWYYSTATNLETQDWTPPRLMVNSWKPITTNGSGGGRYFDGWYPSFMSPGCRPGHLALSGSVFFLNGDSTGMAHQFSSRAFRIDVDGDTPIADAGCSDDN